MSPKSDLQQQMSEELEALKQKLAQERAAREAAEAALRQCEQRHQKSVSEKEQLEQQVQISLKRRDQRLQAAIAIAHELATLTDREKIYQQVATQVKERFDFYYAQILRYEVETEQLLSVAGYGDVGRRMTTEGYNVPLGVGLVGQAAAFGASVLRSNVADDPTWQPHPHLTETKGEIAIPIQMGQQDMAAQAAALKGFAQNEFDGYIVCAIDGDSVAPLVKAALAQGLSVVTQAADFGPGNQSAHIGTKELDTGRALGRQAGEWAKRYLASGETLRVAILNQPTLPIVNEREAGIIAGLEAAFGSNYEVVAREMAPNGAISFPIAERWLRTYPDLHMILAINDSGALGAYRAAKAAGKDDPETFFIGGVDAIDEALEALAEAGVFQATVNNSPTKMALAAFQTLLASIQGQPHPDYVMIETEPVNQANLAEALAARQALLVEDMTDAAVSLKGRSQNWFERDEFE